MVEFIRDEYGVTVASDGHPQSHIPDDPGFLAFEYMQHFGEVLDMISPAAPERIAVTHIGGAGLTMARFVEHTRPGSPQIVLEPDSALTEAVRREVPLPRGHRIRVRAVTGEDGIADLRSDTADVVILDAFADGSVPAGLTTLEFLTRVADVLRPGGVFLANLSDEPGLRYVERVVATLDAAGLPHGCVVATHDVLKGRRHGNVVAVATASEATLDIADLERRLRRSPFPTGVRRDLGRGRRTPALLTAADPMPSPTAPDPGQWRLR